MELANSKDWGGPESHGLLGEFKKELTEDTRFIARLEQAREKQVGRRAALVPIEFKSRTAAWDKIKADALNKLRKRFSEATRDKRIVVECTYLIHIAACNYEQHGRGVVPKFAKVAGHVVRSVQPAKSPVECLKRLDRSLTSTPYVWAKAWAEMTPGAHEALVRGNPKRAVPIFAVTPSPNEIQPFLAGALRFAARATAPSQEKRDELLVTIFIAYAIVTGHRPTLSRSLLNPTMKFFRSVERAYKEFLPNGFNIPSRSHSRLERLRARAINLLRAAN